MMTAAWRGTLRTIDASNTRLNRTFRTRGMNIPSGSNTYGMPFFRAQRATPVPTTSR